LAQTLSRPCHVCGLEQQSDQREKEAIVSKVRGKMMTKTDAQISIPPPQIARGFQLLQNCIHHLLPTI